MRGTLLLMAAAVLLPPPLWAQQGKNPKPADPFQKRVDEAIRKGIEYLRKAESPPLTEDWIKIPNSDELLLLTFLNAGLTEADPKVRDLLERILAAPLEWNYNVALQAMALEELQRVKYQGRIAECAQFLVDTQCKNGQWTYGDSVPKPVPTGRTRKNVATPSKAPAKRDPKDPVRREKPAVTQTIEIKKTRDNTRPTGDNSNSMYAALGLRACFDAGVKPPQETIARAAKWWRDRQYPPDEVGGRGWNYEWIGVLDFSAPPGSITAGGVGSLVIYDYMLGQDWRKDKAVQDGIEWLAKRFTVTENPGSPPEKKFGHYYYLYALERLGMLYGTDLIGTHAWYPEGAKTILDAQRPDGSWHVGSYPDSPVWDTCFAILFLKRATPPLVPVASVDRFKPPAKEGSDK